MKDAKWWTVDTVFAIGLGAVMAGAFGASFFVRPGARTGSALVPTSVLEQVKQQGEACQTVTDEDVLTKTPPNPC